MMQGWHFNLYALNSIAAYESHLGGPGLILINRDRRLGQFKAEQPLNLALYRGLRWIQHDSTDVEGSKGVANGL